MTPYFLKPYQLLSCPPSSSYLIVIPTGHFQGWASQDTEQGFFHALSQRLYAQGVVTLALPFHSRSADPEPTNVFIDKQYQALKSFLATYSELLSKRRLLLLGVSLGAHVLARYLADEEAEGLAVDHCVLVSYVAEQPITVLAETNRLSLIYGANDWIAYPNAGEELVIIPPQEYGPRTSLFMYTTRGQQKEVFVVEGCGHFLEHVNPPFFSDSVDLIAGLLA